MEMLDDRVLLPSISVWEVKGHAQTPTLGQYRGFSHGRESILRAAWNLCRDM